MVAHWDDDDLYLPWHLTRCVAALWGARGAKCVKARGAWFMVGRKGEGGGLQVRGIRHNVFEGQMVFFRERALAHGGYPPWHSGQARHLLGKFHRAGELYKIPDSMDLTSYVYRWGQGVTHISALKNREESGRVFRHANRDFGDGRPLTPADLTPYWSAVLKGAHKTLSKDDYGRFEENLCPSVSEAAR